jgi:hypothetical protein
MRRAGTDSDAGTAVARPEERTDCVAVEQVLTLASPNSDFARDLIAGCDQSPHERSTRTETRTDDRGDSGIHDRRSIASLPSTLASDTHCDSGLSQQRAPGGRSDRLAWNPTGEVADPVAIVSVVTSGTVAVSVPFINERLTRRRLLFESEQRRYDDVRALLDATLGRMGEALSYLHDFEDPHTGEELRASWSAFTSTTDEIFRDQLRLAMRLGDDDRVSRAHDGARETLQHAQATLREWSLQFTDSGDGLEPVDFRPPPRHLPEEAAGAMRSFMEASRDLVGLRRAESVRA